MDDKKPAKVQIKEIAEKLGISTGTVSVVLNGRGDQVRISKETQKRVQDLAKEMNYQPNIYARRLRHSATEEVPYIIALFWREDNLNSRLGRFLKGINQAIAKAGAHVELILQPYKPGDFLQYVSMLSSNHIGGAIISGLQGEEQDELENRDFSIPIVIIGRTSEKFHCVQMDNFRAGEKCAYQFEQTGIRSAAVIGFEHGGKAERLMETGFLSGCRDKKIPVKEDWNLFIEKSSHQAGYYAAKELSEKVELPSCWLVMDCRLAGGMIDYCQEQKIRVPEDLRLIFFEESEILKYNRPGLSSVDVPAADMAEKAAEILLLSRENRMEMPIRQELLPIFHIRESSGKMS